MSRVFAYTKNFLELRLRAFIYACFAMVGFILGVIVANGMAVESIGKYRATINAAILERGA